MSRLVEPRLSRSDAIPMAFFFSVLQVKVKFDRIDGITEVMRVDNVSKKKERLFQTQIQEREREIDSSNL